MNVENSLVVSTANPHGLRVLLTPEEAAAVLGVAKQTLAVWRSLGAHGPRYLKLGRLVRYEAPELERFIQELARNGARQRSSESAPR